MPERNLGPGLRLLLGLIGAVATAAGGAVGASEIRTAAQHWPHWASIAIAAFCVVVALGGLVLVRGAVTGHIVVRRTRFRGTTP
jgi:hypothetical protein